MIAKVKTGLVQPPLAGLKSRRFPFCSRFLFAIRILTVWIPAARGYTRRPIISRVSRYGGISNQSSQNGIPRKDKERLFVKGFGKNTGLGLFLSREILAITGITITENGEPGKGARFEISVPKGMYRY